MEQRRLLRDSLFNLSASVLSALLGLIAIPLFVARLDTGDYADWIVMLATAKTVVIVDFGLGWTIVHIVAGEIDDLRAEATALLRTAATLLSALAVIVALITFVAGMIQFGDLHGHRAVVLLAGAIMAAVSHFNTYNVGILWGLRRYDVAGTIVAGEAAAQSGGVIVILLAGGDIAAVASWEAFVVAAAGIAKMIAANRLCPECAFRPTLRGLVAPRHLVHFSLASQISDALTPFFWNVGVLLLGQVAGSSAVVAFHIGQKIPLALAGFVSRAAEVTLPAASGLNKSESEKRATVAVSSARIAIALCVPAVVTLWLIAEPFVRLWVPQSTDEMVEIMRIAALTVAAYSVGESARYFLWGAGRIVTIVLIQLAGTALLVFGVAVLLLLDLFDATHLSAMQGLAVALMSVAFGTLTAGHAGLTRGSYVSRIARGIPLATAAAGGVGLGLMTVVPGMSWLWLGLIAGGVTATFVAWMAAFGLEPEESSAIRQLIRIS